MRKTIKELADYLGSIVMPESSTLHTLKPEIKALGSDEAIITSVYAFKAYLLEFFHQLTREEKAYDTYKKAPHDYENRITLSVNFTFLDVVKNLLIQIGTQCHYFESEGLYSCDSTLFDTRISKIQTLNALTFLIGTGLVFEGLDIKDKKSLFELQAFKVSYPANPLMLRGLRVMATAEALYGNRTNHDIFLRCDYRVLSSEPTDIKAVIQDTFNPLPKEVQDVIFMLHHHAVNQGYSAQVEIKGFWIYIKYLYKRKEIFGLNASLNNGCHINIKATQMRKYQEIIETFPDIVKEVIVSGFGCGRKIDSVGYCNGGCRGMILPLDHAVIALSSSLIKWFDTEVSYL